MPKTTGPAPAPAPPASVTFDADAGDAPFLMDIVGVDALVHFTTEALNALIRSAVQAAAEQECWANGHAIPTMLIDEAVERRMELLHRCERCQIEVVIEPTGSIVPLTRSAT